MVSSTLRLFFQNGHGEVFKKRYKSLLNLDYVNNLRILGDYVSKMNEFLEVLRVQGARISLKINVKKTKSLRLGISEGEEVMLHIKWTDSLT